MAHKYAVGDRVVLTQGGGEYPLNGFTNGETYGVVSGLKKHHDFSYKYETYKISSGGHLGYARPEYLEPANANLTKGKRIKTLEGEVEALKKRIETLESADKTTYAVNLGPTTITTTDKAEASEIAAELSKQLKKHVGKPNTNQRRKALINEAKAWLDKELPKLCIDNASPLTRKTGTVTMEFYVNKDKRIVTAIPRLRWVGALISDDKAIVKCSPDDVYNEHIGKLIAAHRVLGLEVPRKFTHAVQPDKIVPGTVAMHTEDGDVYNFEGVYPGYIYDMRHSSGSYYPKHKVGKPMEKYYTILDDTEAQYE